MPAKRLTTLLARSVVLSDPGTLQENELIINDDDFFQVIKTMHEEGNGLLETQIITPQDAVKLMLACAHGLPTPGASRLYFLECHKFLTQLEKTTPICAAGECTHKMHEYNDVGVIVIMHGHTNEPTTFIVAGICASCWKEKCSEDTGQAMDAFLSYLQRCLPGMKSFDRDDFVEKMTGNAPSSTAIN
jgi:hypothetical protein